MVNPRVVVLGVAGMLGHKVFQVLRERGVSTVGTAREDLRTWPLSAVTLLNTPDVVPGIDVMRFDEMATTLRRMSPGFVVNCVGIVKQRTEATASIPSIAINALLPHRLAELAREWGGRVIHFSTDCVFSGLRGAYQEDDLTDATDLYGRTKALGEVSTSNALTLRTSMIGRELLEHRSLLDWFLGQRDSVVRGFTKVIYSGVTTNYLASLVADLIGEHPTLSGLLQVASLPISKHDLLCLIRDAYGLSTEIAPDSSVVSDRSMIGERFAAATGYVTPSWPDLVHAMKADATPYHEWLGNRQ